MSLYPGAPSLPAPFCPPSAPPPPSVAAARHAFMLRNCPVLLQPAHDVEAGNGFIALFYSFSEDERTVVCSLVYEAEGSYEAGDERRINRFGSFAYRTYNDRLYARTADIDHLAFHGVRMPRAQAGHEDGAGEGEGGGEGGCGRGALGARPPSPPLWASLHTTDFSGGQRWSRGDKGRFLHFYSLFHHYDLDLQRDGWRRWEEEGESAGPHMDAALVRWRADDAARQRDGVSVEERVAAIREAAASPAPPPPPPVSPAPFGYRAVVWVNTQNHLMAPFDSNGSLPLRVHSSYPLFPGDRRVAERFGQLAVARKWTLFSLLPACLCCRSSIDRRARAERTRWQRVHHSHVLRGAQGEKEDDTHCDSAEGLREGSKQRAVPSHKTAPLSYECSAPHSTP